MTDFFADLERELRRAHRRDSERHPSSHVIDLRRLPRVRVAGLPALVALGVVVALVAVVVTVAREADIERQGAPQPAPGKKLVATDVERGVRFSLDGRVLTVQLLQPVRKQTFDTVSGAEISASCGTGGTNLPAVAGDMRRLAGDMRRQVTVFGIWPEGHTSLSYRFPRDVSRWCRIDRQSFGIVAIVSFPVAWSGAKAAIAETANKWARHFASNPQTCTDYACEQEQGCEPSTSIPDCRAQAQQSGAQFRGATVQAIAIRGNRAAATLSNDQILQLRRIATGEWLVVKAGPYGAVGPDAAAQRRP